VNLFLQVGHANFPCSSSDVVLRLVSLPWDQNPGKRVELTVGLVPRQILNAAEILGTPRTLESLARGCRRGL
jgi:hypothetical protein